MADISEIVSLIAAHPTLEGLNVTIPHKVAVIPFLDEMDEAAREIGAVNCISISRANGQPFLKGYNTDAYGFENSLKPMLQPQHERALIFGDGGAAKAVKFVLKKLGIPYMVVSRRNSPGMPGYEALDEEILSTHHILINTTPLGMSPDVDSYPPIPYSFIGKQHIAYDLVYNPELTAFLARAQQQDAAVKNGLEMLYLQAERSWEIWNNDNV